MSNIRLFFQKSLSLNSISKLDKYQSHYLVKVMRLNIGESFSLFNEKGEWRAEIKDISKGIVNFLVKNKLRSVSNNREIWLAFSPIKFNYQNLMIQKATELGVTKFIPILTDRTIVRKINEKRLNKIIIEASEQSNRLNIPKLNKISNLDTFLKQNQSTNIIFGDINSNNNNLNIKNLDPICILIGPEGDFTARERNSILKLKNIIPIKINENILRSETAAISITSIISFKMLS
tara:strand:- start:3109 stop:3810 length:702 start_codon:yes stop_codon:yes gene_type:complete